MLMKIFGILLLLPVFLSVTPLSLHAEPSAAERTLSPYFFVEQGEADGERFPLLGTQVEVAISGVIAQVTVRQQYVNRGAAPIHGRYVFPGSTRAAVNGMTMRIGERLISAKIKEKEEARQLFTAARQAGKSASLLEQERPNVFSMAVANILPGDRIEVELAYSELLVPTESVYEFVYPTVVGPRYSNQAREGAPPSERWIENPYLKEGSESQTTFDITTTLSAGMPVQEVACPSHATTVAYEGPDTFRVALVPGDFGGDRDYILRYRLAGQKIATGLLLFEDEGENYFLLMAQPPERPQPSQIPGREYIFVVDVSGSMNGFPLNTAKQLLTELLSALRPEDRFNVLLFAGDSTTLAPASLPATVENIQHARDLIDRQRGGGGTELLPAMRRAMALPRSEGVSRSLLVITDGYISAERAVFESVADNLGNANVFAFGIGSSVNRYLIEGLARAGRGEPFVVTDPAEAGAVAGRFCDYVGAPVLTDIKVDYQGIDAYDIEPPAIPDLFASRPLIVFGKWRGESRDQQSSITLSGRSGETPYQQTFQLGEVEPALANEGLRYLWARERIARLSDYASGGADPELRAEIVRLGLTYNLLTAHTSFVAIDEQIRNPGGEGKEVKQPLPLPKSVSNLAVAVSGRSVPEPEFWLVAGLLLALIGLRAGSRPLDMLRRRPGGRR